MFECVSIHVRIRVRANMSPYACVGVCVCVRLTILLMINKVKQYNFLKLTKNITHTHVPSSTNGHTKPDRGCTADVACGERESTFSFY